MSIEAMNWAMWQQRTADPVARQVLLVLANYANEDGKGAFCSVETIECISRLGERTIRRKLDDLQAGGLIYPGNPAVAAAYIDRADRRPQVFDLDVGPVPMRREAVLMLREEKRGAAAAVRSTGCRSDRNGVPESPARGAAPAPKPSITHPLPVQPTTARGTRLTADWEMPCEWLNWASGERPDLDAEKTAEQFRDHWAAKPGKDGLKLDWFATWRNWVRGQRAVPGLAAAKRPAGKHSGFDSKNYREGVSDDGSF